MQSPPPMTLLYIEDNIEIREHLSRFLQKNGHKVLGANDVDGGCALFQSHPIDVVLVDLQLPRQSGMEFIRCLRGKSIQTPVIITTAHTEKEYLLDAINLDVTRYLVKPFKKSELLDALMIASTKLAHSTQGHRIELLHGFSYDMINKAFLTAEGPAQQLSKKEYLLFELLISRNRQIVPYEAIEAAVWQHSPMSIDALRTLVRGMRKKSYPDLIRNINRIGYKIEL